MNQDRNGILNFDALRAAPVTTDPFTYFVAKDVLTDNQAADVRADYPDIEKPGYLPLSKLDRKGAFDQLMQDLETPELAEVLGAQLNLDLADKPRMITVRRLSQKSDGPIHTDSQSKLMTMLIYLNESWDGTGAGCIRALNSPTDFDDYAVEVPPLAGYAFAFARSDCSYHGHLPFAGERYVVQVTFLTSEDELARKENRGGLQLALKKLNPFQ